MTSASAGFTRRVDHCLLAGDVPMLPVVPDGWLAVLVAPDLEVTAGDLAEPVLAGLGGDSVLLLAAGPLGAALAVALDRPVVAPDGPVIQTPGGILVTTDVAGGWWRHRPGRPAEPLGPRWPAPGWQDLVPPSTQWPATVIAQPVPAGWLLSPGPVGAAAAFDGVEFAVAVDPERPRLLLDPTLTDDLLALAMAALPTRVRRVADLVPLAAGQGAGRPIAAAAARRLGEPVHLVNGVPLHPPAGPITVFALDAHRRPVWSEPAWLLRLTPDGAEEVIASSPPHTSLRLIDPATYAMDMGWQVRLSGGGIHALPGPPPPPAKGRASLPDPFDSTRSLSFTVTVPGVLVPNPPPSGAIASTHADAVTVVSDPSPSGAAASTRADTATVGDARTDGEAGSGSGLTGTGAGLAGVGFGHGRVGDDTGIGDGTGGLGATAAVGTRFTTDSPTATRADTATSYGIATSTDIATGQGIGRGTATSTDIATGQGIGRGTGSGAGTNSGAGIGQSIGQGIGGGAGTNSEVGIRGDARDASPASSGTHITNAGNATTDAAIATGAGSDNGTAIATGAGGNNGAATVTSAGGNSGAGVGAGWPGGVGGHRGGGTLPAQEERAGVYRVVVGSAGEVIDDLVWPPLSAMFTALLTDIPAAVDLVVEGKSSAWGGAAERELAERHPGAGVVSGQAREFQRCELLPMPLEPEAPEPPSAVRRARNGLTLLAAAVVVLLVAVAGAVLFWPRGGDGAGLAGGTDPQTAAVPGAGVAAGSPAPSASAASGSASPKASVSASVKASASALASVSGSPGAPSSAASTPPLPLDTATDVARGRPTSESSHTEVYGSGRVTDGDPMSYWESRNNALPQWVQVDLGAPVAVRRVVLRLPPSGAWPARTQNVTVQGSIDGANFTSLTSASCRFDAGNGQRATISVSSGEHRYIRIVISSNTVQPAGQLSSVELYRG